MALDNFRTIELIWDKANKSIIKTIKTASSDTTGRYLSVKILDGGQEVTLNNATLQLYWEHPNFNTSGTDDFNTVNDGGLFKMTFSKEMLTNIGELTAHLVLTLPDGRITSDGFTIEVIKGADDGVVVPTNGSGLVEQVANKIDKGNVTLGDLTNEVKLAMTGGSVAIVGENAVGTENVKESAITPSKIDSIGGEILNILNLDTMLTGKAINRVDDKAVLMDNANWSVNPTAYPVKQGDVVRFNKAFSLNHYFGVDGNGNILQNGEASTDGNQTITVANGVVGFYSNVLNTNKSTAMITVNNQMPTSYTPFGVEQKQLMWLSVSETNLDDDLKTKLNSNSASGSVSNWEDKTMISAGDSITWQDARVYSGTTNVARGWQTVVKENLKLASVKNIAVSGKPMSDGTTAGGGTVTTVLTETSFPEDLFVIAAGTNDFKLNVPIGVLNNVGGTFDRNTFYGAYQTTLEYIINKRPDIRIVLFTPLHRNQSNYNSTIFANTAGHKLTDYVEAIKDIGARYSVPVCDIYANSGINMLTLDVDTRDGLHPNDVGYEKMGRYAAKFINNI